jgi:hypothetical protein
MPKEGLYVRLHTGDEWNGLYGIISEISDEIIAVFCVTMPLYRYFVWRDGNEAQILEYVTF